MTRPFLSFALDIAYAVNFFTRLPGGRHAPDRACVTRSFRAGPIVGAVIGLIGGAVYAGASFALPAFAAASLALGVQLLATGAFHEDGWADFWDGLGGATREDRLTIMRDSRLGTFGAAALILVLMLKASLLAQFTALNGALILIATGALAKGAVVVLMAALPPARGDGLAAEAGAPTGPDLFLALLLALAPAFLLGPLVAGLLIIGGVAGAFAIAAAARRQLGGQTGDVLGAGAVAAECAALVALAAAP